MNDNDLERKLRARSARVAVVGLGYAGLPMAVEFGLGWWRKRKGRVESQPHNVDHLVASPAQPEAAPR